MPDLTQDQLAWTENAFGVSLTGGQTGGEGAAQASAPLDASSLSAAPDPEADVQAPAGPASAGTDGSASEAETQAPSPDGLTSPELSGETPPSPDAAPPETDPASQDDGKALNATEADLFFDKGQVELTASDLDSLDAYAKAYTDAAATTAVTIEGYASIEGDDAFNNEVSNKRAQAVAQYLQDKGIGADKVQVRALGGTDQFDKSDARANRRVVLTPRSPSGGGDPPPDVPLVVTHRTETSAPSNRARTKIGVGERVTLSVKPGPGKWRFSGPAKLSSGSGSTVTLIAGDTEGTIDIAVSVGTQSAALRFTVVAPKTVTMELIGSRHDPAKGPNGGIHTRTFLGPDDVSFVNAAVLEDEIAPSSKGGIFSFVTGHNPNANWIGNTAKVVAGKGTLSNFEDNAFIFVNSTAPPFAGNCTLNIPWSYSVNGGTKRPFATVTQTMVSDNSGTVTISKGGASAAFPLGGAASTYPGAPY